MQTYHLNLRRRRTGRAGKKELSDTDVRGVVYGHGMESVPLVGDYQTVIKVLDQAGTSHIIKLDIDNAEAIDVLVKDLDHEPVSNQLRHFDLMALKKGEKIDVEVPVVLTGEAPAVKLGHVVHQLINELEVRTLPANIPESFEVDISGLSEIGDTVHVSDLTIDSEVEIDEGLLEQPIVKVDEVREFVEEDIAEELSADDVPSERGEEEGDAEAKDGEESAGSSDTKSDDKDETAPKEA
ncbi:MAG TPA: 50S ribosomal protein L25 [Candidatus Saccharimonadales bacterium]|jgi:large subunit ribosomal protein L25